MSYDNLFNGSQDVPNNSQWKIRAESLLADRDIWHPTADKKFPLGALAESRDGRKWRYCENSAATLAIATLHQSVVQTANWNYTAQTNTPAVPVAGDKIVTVVTDTTIAAHELVDGYLYIPDGTGEGNMYIVKDNKASTDNATSGYDTRIEIADTGGIRTAWVAASDITVWRNKYKDILIYPTDPTGKCTGVSMTSIPASYFFWSQVKGPCPIVNGSETVVIGDIVAAGTNTAGAIGLVDVAADGDTAIGYVLRASAATGDYAVIDLNIE